jgi:hypothetical protein
VDPAHRLPQRLAVARPHTCPEAPAVAASAPLLGGPVALDVLVRLCAARGPKNFANTERTSSLRCSGGSFPALRACLPSRKPRSTPQRRSCGELSKMTLTSSSREKTDPESPSARQKGSG